MKKSVLEGNLQILLRSQNNSKTQALSAFFDPNDCHGLYPDEVDCLSGLWKLEENGSARQPDRMFKVWAVYGRVQNEVAMDGKESKES